MNQDLLNDRDLAVLEGIGELGTEDVAIQNLMERLATKGVNEAQVARSLDFLGEHGYTTGQRNPMGHYHIVSMSREVRERYVAATTPGYGNVRQKVGAWMLDNLPRNAEVKVSFIAGQVGEPLETVKAVLDAWCRDGLVRLRPQWGDDAMVSGVTETLRRLVEQGSIQ